MPVQSLNSASPGDRRDVTNSRALDNPEQPQSAFSKRISQYECCQTPLNRRQDWTRARRNRGVSTGHRSVRASCRPHVGSEGRPRPRSPIGHPALPCMQYGSPCVLPKRKGRVTRSMPVASAYGRPFQRAGIRSASGSAKVANAGEHVPRLLGRVVYVSAKGVIDALGFTLVGNMPHGRRCSGHAVRVTHNQRGSPPRRPQGLVEVWPVAIPAASHCRHRTPMTSSTTLSAGARCPPFGGDYNHMLMC